MSFLNSLNDRLTTMEQEIQALPEELYSIVRRLDRGKWENLLVRVNEDFNKLLDKLSAAQSSGILALPLIFDPQSFSFTPITSEDRARWREVYKSKVRVVIGGRKVEVVATSKLAEKYKTTVPQITPVARKQGYIVVSWDQYIKLLDEIGKLIEE